jgi:hypothetical protein
MPVSVLVITSVHNLVYLLLDLVCSFTCNILHRISKPDLLRYNASTVCIRVHTTKPTCLKYAIRAGGVAPMVERLLSNPNPVLPTPKEYAITFFFSIFAGLCNPNPKLGK